MGRATFVYKTKQELLAMNEDDIRIYISWLKERARHLGTLPRRSVQKILKSPKRCLTLVIPP